MSRGRKGKNLGSKSQTVSRPVEAVDRERHKKAIGSSKTASSPRRATRFDLRSRPSVDTALLFVENPDRILQKSRKPQKVEEGAPTQDQLESFLSSRPDSLAIDASLTAEYRRIGYVSSQEYSDEELPLLLPDTDSMQTFYRNWGYLPPLDVEVVAIIDAIIADPIKAGEFTRMGAEHPDFPDGLDDRNVDLGESSTLDSHADHIKFLAPEESASETDGEKELHGQLWTLDQARCNEGSNEAFFQRTLMMSLIARHSIIYQRGARNKRYLDFSVEEAWTCPPMPTRAYGKGLKFLTQPKPDLAVCFRRQSLIPDNLWKNLPNATKRLACYENTRETGRERVFHFLTIEAKKANISADDTVGKRQSLNNASQALHNMFEFFRDAGAEHENNFFTKVRFFSVVASTEGLTIRIHRATREPDKECFIILDYSLRFEYQEFLYIQKHSNFDRETVIRTFKTILIAYGANELRFLFSDAAKALVRRLKRDPKGLKSRQNVNFYRYGQTVAVPKSRTATPAPSRAPSGMGNSSDMLRGGTFSPMQSQVLFPVQTSNALRKRLRAQSEDTTQSRTKRQRRK